MEGFTYTNIFETKGIEYIAIIIFFLFLIPFWIFLNRKARVRQQVIDTMRALSMNLVKIPKGIYFSKNHTWAFLERSGEAKIGIDDLLVHLTGPVVLETVPESGSMVRKGDLIARIRQGEKELRISSPLSGRIISQNPSVISDPGLLTGDPYNHGWICSISPENWMEETRSFYVADKATQWASQELRRFKDFIAFSLKDKLPDYPMVVLQDGGEICDHALSGVPGEVWVDFQKEFLDNPSSN